MAVNSLGAITAAQRTILEEQLVLTALPKLQHIRFAKRRPFNPREGRAVTFARQTRFTPATTALTEGTAPEGETVAYTTTTITPSRYGSFSYVGEELVDKGIFDVVSDVNGFLGHQAGWTSDRLAREILRAGGTTQTADGVAEASQTTANLLDAAELVEALQTLANLEALPFSELDEKYPLIAHPFPLGDLMLDPLIRNTFYYAYNRGPENPLFGHSLGDWMGIRFYQSSDAYVNDTGGSGNQDTYHSLLIGREAYAVAGFGAMLPDYVEGGTGTDIRPVQLIVHGRGDYPPLDQRESIGWKLDQGQSMLNSNFMIRVITASAIDNSA